MAYRTQVVSAHLLVAALAVLAPGRSCAASTGPDLESILAAYNARLESAMVRIETLRVAQEMIEPADDGEKRASAVLVYRRGEGMVREESFSDLGHPVGEYSLESLVGPSILTSEYEVTLAGEEEMEGARCYRLELLAIERDTKHFDGTVWIEADGFGLVRITGEVADPPFPVQRIALDKAFETVPEGVRLLRRHTGEVRIRLAFVTREGMAHIFYGPYSVGLSAEGDESESP